MTRIWHFDDANHNLLKFNRDRFRYPSCARPYLDWLKLWFIGLSELDDYYYSYMLSPEAKVDFLLRWS